MTPSFPAQGLPGILAFYLAPTTLLIFHFPATVLTSSALWNRFLG